MAVLLRAPHPRLPLSLPPLKPLRSPPKCLPFTPLAIATPPQIAHRLAVASASIAAIASLSARRLASCILSFSHPSPHELVAIQSLRNSLSLSVAPLCFAAISHSAASVNTPLTVVASGMAKWLELYSGVLMVRVLLSWFPNIPWERQPLQAIRDMCDPYLNLFRNIIPPVFNALDLSPLLAFLVLGMLASVLNTTIQT